MRVALVGLTVLGTLLSGCSDGGSGSGYPDAYLLYADELPSGTELKEVDPSWAQAGIDSNPDEFPRALAQQYMQQYGEFAPDIIWGELVGRTDGQGSFVIISAFWNDQDKLDQGLAQIKTAGGGMFCSYMKQGNEAGAGRMLRDGPVLVLMGVGDNEMRDYVEPITANLKAKSPALTDVCS